MRHAVAIVLVGIAVLVLAASADVAYGLAAMYGGDTPGEGQVHVVLVLVPGALALLCLVGARDPVGRPRPRTSVLALGVLAVSGATVTGAAAYGDSVHERGLQARTTACTPQDVALLAAVDAPGPRSEVMGEDDGGCSVLVSGVPDEARATQDVVAALERAGWQRVADAGGEPVFSHEGAVLRLSASSDGKVTDVRLTLE